MSGVRVQFRARRRDNVRPRDRYTRSSNAEVMRGAALSMLRAPYCNDEMREHANAMLELIGDMLDLPRHGWYPKAPKGWRA